MYVFVSWSHRLGLKKKLITSAINIEMLHENHHIENQATEGIPHYSMFKNRGAKHIFNQPNFNFRVIMYPKMVSTEMAETCQLSHTYRNIQSVHIAHVIHSVLNIKVRCEVTWMER